MREFRLEVFNDLYEAMSWLEQEMYDLTVEYQDIKGEITLIDGKWRVGIIVDSRQTEMNV